MADQQLEENTPLEELTPEEASRIIHSHRKVRYVKCDNKQPCENCVKRDHPKLCSYKPNRSTKQGSVTSDISGNRKRPHSPGDDGGHERHHDPPGHTDNWVRAVDDNESIEVSRYLGQNSIPALLREQSGQNDGQDGSVRQDMRSILGLDNSAPFPLMSARHLDRLTTDIASELPSDREVMKLFTKYKEIPQPFWGFVIDIDELEAKLMEYLEERAKNARNSVKTTKPVSASWLAILFSVLAVGSQYHDSPYDKRRADAQNYMQISFHFLRLGNFLLRPTLDSIQAMLLTGFVLLNDMKAEASWALLGLTCRLAQSLGLHLPSTQTSRANSPAEAQSKDMVRRRLWWTCVWHDTLTSLSFDRSTMTNIPCCAIPETPQPCEGWTYLDAMYRLCQGISVHLNPEAAEKATYDEILANCDEFESIREKVVPQLRSKASCKSANDRLQYFAIRLHTSFAMSVSCRPALRRQDSHNLDAAQKQLLADKCKENLAETVRMFLAMHQLSVIPTRSWAFTYHGLSSALLLGLLRETQGDPEVRQLQKDLISALSATAAKDTTPDDVPKTDKDIELSGPLARALMALRQIYDHGAVGTASIKQEADASGTLQPMLPPGGMINSRRRTPAQFGGQPAIDPHRDAALAMAEMQNGNVQEFPSSATMSPYPQQTMDPQLPAGDISQFGSSGPMSAMEMYNSIFWDPPPDPWNSGMVDSMNFDFLAHPPPGQAQGQFYF
ncbi:uncharacterized protein MKZ38_001869 [Zalerion maritima]|uniref:Xylanolytic transcriptional activator regulatory domain-containing protein n=1 Tax=Zalerion maritima TaxID=339359 RepID=A0AAD5RQR5_9PEZI|nr:uncharacterized protein MKZ38_001869 [Zalerion maritima]